MFRVSAIRPLGFAATLACGVLIAGAARAADIDEPYYGPRDYPRQGYEPAPYPPQAFDPRYVGPRGDVDEDDCRVRHERHVDAYGREVVRRLRVCDEGVVAVHPRYRRDGYRDRPYDAPSPRAWMRPPADVGPDDDGWE
jgi:hypothetical protein